VLARLDLAAVEELDRTRHEEEVALPDHPVQERLARPRALDEPGPVPDHRLEDPQPDPGRDDALARDLPDHRGVHPDLERPDRRHGARVLVPPGDVVEEVPCRVDAHAREDLRALRPHALEVLDRPIQRRYGCRRPDGPPRQAVRTSFADCSASNGSRSSIPSPVPTSLTGIPTCSLSATTIPPFAVLSSFERTSPVSCSISEKIRTCRSEEHTSELQSRENLVCRLL